MKTAAKRQKKMKGKGPKAVNELGEFLKGFRSGLSNIRSGIGKFNAQEADYSNRSIHENEMREKHIYPEIDQGAREGAAQLLRLANVLDPSKAGGPLVFQRTYDPNHDLTKLIAILHFLLADIEKRKIKELYETEWPKNAISSEQHQRNSQRSVRHAPRSKKKKKRRSWNSRLKASLSIEGQTKRRKRFSNGMGAVLTKQSSRTPPCIAIKTSRGF